MSLLSGKNPLCSWRVFFVFFLFTYKHNVFNQLRSAFGSIQLCCSCYISVSDIYFIRFSVGKYPAFKAAQKIHVNRVIPTKKNRQLPDDRADCHEIPSLSVLKYQPFFESEIQRLVRAKMSGKTVSEGESKIECDIKSGLCSGRSFLVPALCRVNAPLRAGMVRVALVRLIMRGISRSARSLSLVLAKTRSECPPRLRRIPIRSRKIDPASSCRTPTRLTAYEETNLSLGRCDVCPRSWRVRIRTAAGSTATASLPEYGSRGGAPRHSTRSPSAMRNSPCWSQSLEL